MPSCTMITDAALIAAGASLQHLQHLTLYVHCCGDDHVVHRIVMPTITIVQEQLHTAY